MKKILLVLALFIMSITSFAQNPWNGKVVLQGFWWDYWNDNYPHQWADYLSDLAPTMKSIGIDGVWIPPSSKGWNDQGILDNGYGIYDHYDLGDKYQKGYVYTRLGTKDEYLRMIGIFHSNGIDAIQDIVLNHVIGAGVADPMAQGDQYKNFRYTSYSTPATTNDANDYLARNGRWSKNWPNFCPNNHVGEDYPLHSNLVGADIYYGTDGWGSSSNAIYNPVQYDDYMKFEAIKWGVWMKKQTGIDGVRLDAVKHFEHDASEAFLWNLQHGSNLFGDKLSWADGGDHMYAVGEYPDEFKDGIYYKADDWVNDVQNRSGTFDFILRNEIYNMIQTNINGSYDLSKIVGGPLQQGTQFRQSKRERIVTFINNHDVFRPNQFYPNGDYKTFKSTSLGSPILPTEGRIQMSYALIFALDGSPQVFFEDLFVVNNLSRQSHTVANLQSRDYLTNIIWCNNNLKFKDPSAVETFRWADNDVIIIERLGKAIIAVTDNWNTTQKRTVNVSWASGTTLHDYSGTFADTPIINGKAEISIPPCDGSALSGRRGYSIWAPPTGNGLNNGYYGAQGYQSTMAPRTTTQEWEMADDLGDSNPLSLKQGGALPATGLVSFGPWETFYSRTAGRIFASANSNINVELFRPGNNGGRFGFSTTVAIYGSDGTIKIKSVSGITNPITLNYFTSSTGYYTLKAWNSNAYEPKTNVFVKATYSAPPAAMVSNFPKINENGSDLIENSNENDIAYEFSLLSNYPNPFNPTTSISFTLPVKGFVTAKVYNMLGQEIAVLQKGEMEKGMNNLTWDASRFSSGIYLYSIQFNGVSKTGKMILSK